MSNEQFKCSCGATFNSQAELMEHASKVHAKPEHKCNCGTVFHSQGELTEHVTKMHKK